MKKVGFIGLGIMGRAMVANLLKAGVEVTAFDVVPEAVKAAAEKGAKPAKSAKEASAGADIVILSVPSGPIVRSVLTAEDGILAGTAPGTVIVDTSSITPTESQEFYKLSKDKGCGFLDAPVSGGEEGAIAGTLAIMVGGDADDLEAARPVLDILSKTVTHVGPSGAGSVTKLTNQVIVNLNIAAVAEGLILAQKAGADPKKVFEAIRGGLAGSQVLNDKAPRMYNRDFKPGGSLAINLKDITNVMETAKSLDLPLIMTGQLLSVMRSLKSTGHLMDDHAGIVQFYEQISGVTVETKEK
ncbi:2-hydroxy-3-oxopropionate reductase [Selenomonas sp. TAMA-11512]|uniref:NAD(P)-binding domain-containing protein n=1 Tax=Selenomonas sp. TAMA-11512 TaxID=3095337 RepID=UPI003087CDD1|nr:2-hydroxy-3-oxopropionate reductase [Selenomonas sp. TAMA-11512]